MEPCMHFATVSSARKRIIALLVAIHVSNANDTSVCLCSVAVRCSLPLLKICVRAFIHTPFLAVLNLQMMP
jgi:hypothetical protein